MTKLEQLQEEFLDLLGNQITSLSLMSKIELGDDVIQEIQRLQEEIKLEKQNSVPFVDEVQQFNEIMGKSWQNRTQPTINEDDANFVINFIKEELQELEEAVKNRDIVEVLDAIADITYVCLGNGVMSFGLKDKILPAYDEVQRSNLSKVCRTEEEAKETVELRSKQQGEACHYEKIGENYIVFRSRDMKVMKNKYWSEPNLRQFFTEEEIQNCRIK
jgi:predicted HAD superfamily Cof-like phosphohydrolase